MNKRVVYPAALLAAALTASGAWAQQGLRLQANGQTSPATAAATEAAQAPGPQARSGSGERKADGIAAVVGDQVITDYDLDLHVRQAEAQIAGQGQTPPPAAQLRAQILEQLIDQYALAEFAEQSGLSVDEPTLQQAIAQMAASNQISPQNLRERVQATGMGWNDYKAQLKREILISRLRQRDVASRIQVSDQDVDAFLAKNKNADAQAPVELAQIFVPVSEHADAAQVDAARQRIDQAAALLQQGRSFAAVAAQVDSGVAALGTRRLDQWPSLFADAVRTLQAGQVTPVLRSPAGFHILEVVSRSKGAGANAMQAQVREIVLDANDDKTRQAATKELAAVREAVDAGKVSFEAKARELSQDSASAKRGGEIGWVLPGELPAALDAALDAMNPGQVSDPIVLPDRVVLLQLLDRREHALAPGQERAVARNALLQQKQAKAFEELIKDVRARTYVRLPDPDL